MPSADAPQIEHNGHPSANPWISDQSRPVERRPDDRMPSQQLRATAPAGAGQSDGRPDIVAQLAQQVTLAQQAAEQAVQAQRAAEQAAQQAMQAHHAAVSSGQVGGQSAWRTILADARRYLVSLPFLIMLPVSIGLNFAAMAGTATTTLKDATAKTVDATAFTHSMIGLAFGGASLLAMMFGALTITRDFGNKFIIRESFLAGGVEKLGLIKLGSIFPPLLLFGLTAPPTGLIFTAIRLSEFDKSVEWDRKTWMILVGLVFTSVAAGYFGHFVGWLIRNSVISVIALAAWTLLLEGQLINLMHRKGQWLPGGAMQTVLRDTSSIHDLYPVWAGYLIYLGWLVLLAAGVVVRIRRTDLT